MSEVNRVLIFKSNDARKQHPRNKPGNFTARFRPEIILDSNKQYFIALDHLSMTASWHNIRLEYGNDKLKISKDNGKTFETLTFPSGVYDYDDINNFIQEKIGKIGNTKIYGINIFFDLTTFKVFIKLNEDYSQIDFGGSGNFSSLLGFKKELLKTSAYGENFPNISNSIDNLYLRCSLLSDSIISGKRSNVLYTFSTNTNTRTLPF